MNISTLLVKAIAVQFQGNILVAIFCNYNFQRLLCISEGMIPTPLRNLVMKQYHYYITSLARIDFPHHHANKEASKDKKEKMQIVLLTRTHEKKNEKTPPLGCRTM